MNHARFLSLTRVVVLGACRAWHRAIGGGAVVRILLEGGAVRSCEEITRDVGLRSFLQAVRRVQRTFRGLIRLLSEPKAA